MTTQSIDQYLDGKRTEPGLASFLQGDSRDLSTYMKDPIDVTISSPPYWGLKDYGVDGQIGHEGTYDEYLSILVNVFGQVYGHTRDTGSLWLVLDAIKQGGQLRLLPFDLAAELQKHTEWKLTDVIIWNKIKNLPWSSKGNLRHNHEFVLFFTRSPKYKFHLDRVRQPSELKDWWHDYPERYNPNGKSPTDIWDIMIPIQGWGKPYLKHWCPFPPKLVERIVELTTKKGDLVFDPFGGSGIVLAVASVMGRRAVGIEINNEYIERFRSKVLPDIQKLWRSRKSQLVMRERTRTKLRDGIITLRQIKFAKMLGRKMAGSGTINPPDYIISEIGEYRKSKRGEKSIQNKLTLVYQDSASPSVGTILELCNKPPLASFGITPDLRIVASSELGRRSNKMWVYRNGSISRATPIDLSTENWKEALEDIRGDRPLVLADKKVDVPGLDSRLKDLAEHDRGWAAMEVE